MSAGGKPKPKRKTLPKDFEEILKTGDLAKLKAVFDNCDVDARGSSAKRTALAFDDCPDALARWLATQGADISAADIWGNTPLHSRARSWRGNVAVLVELGADVHSASGSIGTPLHAAADAKHAENARLLIAAGANVDAKNNEGLTPLELALRGCSNAELDRMPALVRVMLEAGAACTPTMKNMVQRIGKTFEFHRERFDRKSVGEASAALDFLYATFDVPPVLRSHGHDGTTLIAVKSTTWQKQHAELWELLVPSKGPAKTVQGEVVRIAGRISDEWERNGGANWDRDYDEMAHALLTHVGTGTALAPAEVEEIASIVRSLRKSGGARNDRVAALAVGWVLRNPKPIALPRPSYRR
jgi:hypothetical protein